MEYLWQLSWSICLTVHVHITCRVLRSRYIDEGAINHVTILIGTLAKFDSRVQFNNIETRYTNKKLSCYPIIYQNSV